MTATTMVSFRAPVLPWAVSADDERRFKRILRSVLLAAGVFAVALPWLPVMQRERNTSTEVPLPVARLILENAPKPLAPPVVAQKPERERTTPAPAQEEAPKAEAAKAEAPKPKPAPGKPRVLNPVPDQPAVTEARNPVPGKPPGEALDNARRRASGVGLLAMKDQLAELRGAPAAVQLNPDLKPGPGVGVATGPGVGAGTEPGLPARAVIAAGATQGSGGINVAQLSRDTGGGGLAGRSTTMVEGVAGGGGGGGPGGGGGGRGGKSLNGNGVGNGGGMGTAAGTGGGTLQKAGGGRASRSIEEIRLVFERNKGSIYAIYNRALREEPGLQGKVVVELKIAPEGQVLSCRLVSSELQAPELEQKLLARIRSFSFSAKDVETMVVTWPVDFLPS